MAQPCSCCTGDDVPTREHFRAALMGTWDVNAGDLSRACVLLSSFLLLGHDHLGACFTQNQGESADVLRVEEGSGLTLMLSLEIWLKALEGVLESL